MAAIHVHESMTLDGVADAPVWAADYGFHPKMAAVIGALTTRSSGILLGRTTYELLEAAWSTQSVEEVPAAAFFNETRKYVVSSTLTRPTWNNSEVIGRYNAETIRRLKEAGTGHLYVTGSLTLVRAMLLDRLVDGLHLFIHPLTRGSGVRLAEAGDPPTTMTRMVCDAYDNGVTYMGLRPNA